MHRLLLSLLLLSSPVYADLVIVGQSTGITVGSAVTGGTATRVLFVDGSGNLAGDADLTFSIDILTVTKIATTTFTGAPLGSSGISIGAQGTPFQHLWIYGGGTFGSHSFQITGTPTDHRVITLPNATTTLGGLAVANTWTALQTLNRSSAGAVDLTVASGEFVEFGSSRTIIGDCSSSNPNSGCIGVGTVSNALNFGERADVAAFNFALGPCGASACTNPQFITRDKDQNTTDYQALSVSGLTGKSVKTLTESAATSTVRINVAAEAGGSGVYYYSIYATDGSTPQIRSGRVIFSVTNDGGTETCVLGTPEETDNTPTGTLTVTVTCDTTPTNAVDIQLNAVSDLSQTTLEAYSQTQWVGPGAVDPQ